MDIKYSDNQEHVTVKERRIIINKTVAVLENTSLQILEQELKNIEEEQSILDRRRTELKTKINSIGTALEIDVEKEIPLVKI